jgi:hypothetical protein
MVARWLQAERARGRAYHPRFVHHEVLTAMAVIFSRVSGRAEAYPQHWF